MDAAYEVLDAIENPSAIKVATGDITEAAALYISNIPNLETLFCIWGHL